MSRILREFSHAPWIPFPLAYSGDGSSSLSFPASPSAFTRRRPSRYHHARSTAAVVRVGTIALHHRSPPKQAAIRHRRRRYHHAQHRRSRCRRSLYFSVSRSPTTTTRAANLSHPPLHIFKWHAKQTTCNSTGVSIVLLSSSPV